MAIRTPNNPLLVFEYGGTARSGKGTIVADIAERHDGIRVEETGADYRVVAYSLLDLGEIEATMPDGEIQRILGRYSVGSLAEIVADRPSIVSKNGLDVLYSQDVTEAVSRVSPIRHVRTAVKNGFIKRVRAVAQDETAQILLVDGRNLASVIRDVDEAELVMRTFVRCQNVEAARREVERSGRTDPQAFREFYTNISERNRRDAERELDPVKAADNALEYWSATRHETMLGIARVEGIDLNEAFAKHWPDDSGYVRVLMKGIGTLAVQTDQQIDFETSPYRFFEGSPKKRMLDAANTMFIEGYEAYRYAQAKSHETRAV